MISAARIMASQSQIIAIITLGSRGDVQPYVALGRGLAQEGYAVRIVTLEPFCDFVESHGLQFKPIPDPLTSVEDSASWKEWQSSDCTLWRKLRTLHGLLQEARPALIRTFDACLEACRGSHAVLSAFTGFPGPRVAADLGVPHVWALLQPSTPTREFATILSPRLDFKLGLLNLASHRVADAGFRWMFSGALREWADETDVHMPGSSGTVVYGFSPVLIPRPSDWGSDVHISGYWRLDAAAVWTPPEQLSRFYDRNDHPVCLCHGVIDWRSSREALDMMVEAVHASGHPGVIVSEALDAQVESVSDSCIIIEPAPFEWLFPRACLVVHHGGAGTTATALRAGRPSLVLPSCFDQAFWAYACRRLGVAPRPLAPHRVTVRTLADSIRETLSSGRYVANAKRYGEIIRKEDGVRCAVEILGRHLRGGPRGEGIWNTRRGAESGNSAGVF